MILDYKNNKEFALANGISPEDVNGEIHFNSGEVCEGITFKNFYHLCLDEATFNNCIFEDCHEIAASDCEMNGSTFKNVDGILGHYTDFSGCTFKECCSNGPLLTIDSRGQVDNCTFDTITALSEDGYVIYSVFGKKKDVTEITNCRFTDCQVESEDGELCYCAYFKPLSSFNTIPIDNVDYDSCKFDEVDAIEIGSFDLEVPEGDYDGVEIIGSFVSEEDE